MLQGSKCERRKKQTKQEKKNNDNPFPTQRENSPYVH